MNYDDNEYAYVIAECRPTNDDDQYTDVVIDDEHYIFTSIEACKDVETAMYTAIDIERTQPNHKHITLHHDSLQKLLAGIHGEYEPQPKREVFKLLELAKQQGIKS